MTSGWQDFPTLDGPAPEGDGKGRPSVSGLWGGIVVLAVVTLVLLFVGYARSQATQPLPDAPKMYPDGSYKFLNVQKYDPAVPVSYNQCKDIEVAMNPQAAPPEAEEILKLAVDDIRRATGFEIRYAGHSVERPDKQRRTGPILVTFTDEAESPTMTEEIAGRGGSSYTAYSGERAWYSTGQVMLSAEYFTRLSAANDTSRMRAVIDHELAHVMGLDHVEDPGELMHPSGERLQFGHGDLTGLAVLGTQPC